MMTNVITIDNDDGDCHYCAYDDGDYVRVIMVLKIIVMIWSYYDHHCHCDDVDDMSMLVMTTKLIVIKLAVIALYDDAWWSRMMMNFWQFWRKKTFTRLRNWYLVRPAINFTKVTSNAKRYYEKASNVTCTFTVIYSPVCNQSSILYTI